MPCISITPVAPAACPFGRAERSAAQTRSATTNTISATHATALHSCSASQGAAAARPPPHAATRAHLSESSERAGRKEPEGKERAGRKEPEGKSRKEKSGRSEPEGKSRMERAGRKKPEGKSRAGAEARRCAARLMQPVNVLRQQPPHAAGGLQPSHGVVRRVGPRALSEALPAGEGARPVALPVGIAGQKFLVRHGLVAGRVCAPCGGRGQNRLLSLGSPSTRLTGNRADSPGIEPIRRESNRRDARGIQPARLATGSPGCCSPWRSPRRSAPAADASRR